VHNHGGSNAAVTENAARGWLGSDYLLSAAGPVFLGPRFAERIVTPERTYKNHAFGVGWMAHEMIHLWGVRVRFKPPIAGPDLHWSPLLETKVVAPVASLFADRMYREGSVMGGMEIFKGEDGRLQGKNSEGAVSGLSALDLWLMGLIRASEVPPGHEDMRLVVDNEFVSVRLRYYETASQGRMTVRLAE
jgi:hypothetical protein